ncbi:hypothetical protein [Chroococcidiopsis sp. CCMEE 29]|uniref:hypothetical protein n=1 Tax=Chroococcidiopsis sp. CCMEE 29 TaxID=155894 RepID=UPI002021A16E|nr:hypothetical protein [Chroococcidiopsis sp. CCMEE 29]
MTLALASAALRFTLLSCSPRDNIVPLACVGENQLQAIARILDLEGTLTRINYPN